MFFLVFYLFPTCPVLEFISIWLEVLFVLLEGCYFELDVKTRGVGEKIKKLPIN